MMVEVASGARGHAGVHLDALMSALLQVRLGHHDLAVELVQAQQRRVQDVGPVGGRDHDHAALGVEPVQLDEHLVQRSTGARRARRRARAAVLTTASIRPYEHDRGGVRFGLLEQVTDSGGTDTDEHLDEVLDPETGVERHASLAGHGPASSVLPVPGGP